MLEPRYSPWNRIVCFAMGSGLITVLFYVVVVVVLSAARVLWEPSARLEPGDMERYALPMTVLSYPPLLGWILYCRHFLDRRSVRSMGLRLDRAGSSMALGVVGGTLAVAWLFGAMWLSGALIFGGTSPEAFERTPAQVALSLGVYALMFLAVAFMEELSFRGYLLHNLSASLKLRGAIWMQAIVFAAIHLLNVPSQANDPNIGSAAWADAARAMPSLALVGAIFALMWAKSGSLWPSIGFHFAWNFCLGCIFSLPVSGLTTFRLFDLQAVGSPWISGGTFGAEGSVLLWPILAGAWWVLSRLPDHPQVARDLSLLDPHHPATLTEAQLAQMQNTPDRAQNGQGEVEAHESRLHTSMRPGETQAQAEPEVSGWTAPAPSSPFENTSSKPVPAGDEPAPSPTIFSPLPFERVRQSPIEPVSMPGGVPDATLQVPPAEQNPEEGGRWQFQPMHELAAASEATSQGLEHAPEPDLASTAKAQHPAPEATTPEEATPSQRPTPR